MSKTLLEQLSEMTVVVADTGDIESIGKFRPRDATTNPSLITTAAQMPEYAPIVDEALLWSRKAAGAGATKEDVLKRAIDRLAVEFGLRILKIVPGRVSTEVNARLSFDTKATVEKARTPDPAVRGGRCFALTRPHQDRVDLGRDSRRGDPRKGGDPLQPDAPLRDPSGGRMRGGKGHADLAVRGAHPRLVQEGYGARLRAGGGPRRAVGDAHLPLLQAARSRHRGHGRELPQRRGNHGARGMRPADHSPALLAELSVEDRRLAAKLEPKAAAALGEARITVDEAAFRSMHAADRMAHDKLEEGIAGFTKALVALEKLLADRLAALGG